MAGQPLGVFPSRLVFWRCPWPWYAVLVIGIPVLFFAGATVKGEHLTMLPLVRPAILMLGLAIALWSGLAYLRPSASRPVEASPELFSAKRATQLTRMRGVTLAVNDESMGTSTNNATLAAPYRRKR